MENDNDNFRPLDIALEYLLQKKNKTNKQNKTKQNVTQSAKK